MGARPANGLKQFAPSEGFDRREVVWLVFMSLALFVLLLPISSYVAALPDIQREWGLNNTEAGLVYSAYLSGYAFAALVVVPLTDRVGAKSIFMASAVISLVAHLLFPLVASDMLSAVLLRALRASVWWACMSRACAWWRSASREVAGAWRWACSSPLSTPPTAGHWP